VNALANENVGKYVNKYFVSSFQRVGTFRIVGKAKQGGNVAAYFCAPDGRVLHAVAGPVNADTMLKECKWVVETTEAAIKESKGDGGKFKSIFRTAHAKKLKAEFGLVVEPVTFDVAESDKEGPLTYNDPTGQPLALKLPPPPIEGPDVSLKGGELASRQKAEAANAPGAKMLLDRGGKRWVLGNQGRVHMLFAAHSMKKLEQVYGSVFEGILGEKVTTKPVQVATPFVEWQRNNAKSAVIKGK